jgi:hypothetical protein
MDARHRWICQRVAEVFQLTPEKIEEFCNQNSLVPQLTHFFQDPAHKKLLFYQKGEAPFAFIPIS